MGKYRAVQSDFWTDPRVMEELTPEDRYFFLYLLTGPNTTQIGIYEITRKQMEFDLGYSRETIENLIKRFSETYDMIRYNKETRELAIKNWGRYNLNKGGKPMLDCVNSELKEVKDTNLISYVAESVENAGIRDIFDSYTYRDTTRDTIRTTSRGQKEKEKEKEKEEEKQKAFGASAPRDDFEEESDFEDPSSPNEESDKEKIIREWNSLDANIPKIEAINPSTIRSRLLKARIHQYGVDGIFRAIERIRESSFLKGYATNFVITFDWFLKPNNFIKVLEGNYRDNLPPNTSPGAKEADAYNQMLYEWANGNG